MIACPWVGVGDNDSLHRLTLTTTFCVVLLLTHVAPHEQNLRRTNAFEVHYDGELIYSKLKENRMPSYEEIVTAIGAMRTKNGYDESASSSSMN